jgi:hypothetical protein
VVEKIITTETQRHKEKNKTSVPQVPVWYKKIITTETQRHKEKIYLSASSACVVNKKKK